MSELKVLKATNYLNIQGWMVTELQLKGNQLLIYAVIYGFSQDEEGWFHGSRAYIAEWCSIDQRNVTSNLAKLVNDGLILKDARNEDTGLCNRYRVNPDRLGFLNNCPERPKGMGLQEEEGTEESEQPSAKDGNIRQLNELSHVSEALSEGGDVSSPPLEYERKPPQNKASIPEKGGFQPEETGSRAARGVMKHQGRGDETSPDNKEDNKDNNKDFYIPKVSSFSSYPEALAGREYIDRQAPQEADAAKQPPDIPEEAYREQLRNLPEQAIPPIEKQEKIQQALKAAIDYKKIHAAHREDPRGLQILEDIVGTLTNEVYMCRSETIRFGRSDNDTRLVQMEVSKLTREQVESVMSNLKRIEKRPRNIISYLLTSLYRSLHSQACQAAISEYAAQNGRNPPGNRFSHFPQRDYDYKKLEQELFKKQLLGEGEGYEPSGLEGWAGAATLACKEGMLTPRRGRITDSAKGREPEHGEQF